MSRVAGRRDRSKEQWIGGFPHPGPEAVAQLKLDAGGLRVAGEISLLKRIGLEVVQLDHAWPVHRVAAGVGAKDGAELDVGRHLDRKGGLEVADVLMAMRADAPHGVVVAVEGLLRKDRLAPRPDQGLSLDARGYGDAARLEERGQDVDVAHQLRPGCAAAGAAGRPAHQ
ncbi:MAG: hypothetical protein E6I89_04120, partial [Chloroflexi bacterium]